MKKEKAKYKYWLMSVCSVLTVLFIWELVTDILHLISPMMLPSPAKVLNTFLYKLTGGVNPDGATLLQHIGASMKIALGGYTVGVVIGVPLGIAMAWSRRFELFAKPLFDVIRPIPALAWIPLMILWLGIGYWSKVGIIFFLQRLSVLPSTPMQGSREPAGFTCGLQVPLVPLISRCYLKWRFQLPFQ